MRALFIMMVLMMLAAPTAATAGLISVNDRATLPAASTITTDFAAVPLGANSAPITILSGTPAEAQISAPGALFRSITGILTTVLDSDAIQFTFSQPVAGFGVDGGITDFFFDYIDGTIEIAAAGDTATFATSAAGAGFLGVLSDTTFTTVTLSIVDFDTNATSVAFLGLEEAAVTTSPAAVPVAGTLFLLAPGLAGIAAFARRRRRRM